MLFLSLFINFPAQASKVDMYFNDVGTKEFSMDITSMYSRWNQYEYTTNDENEVQYLVHCLNSMKFIDDKQNIYSSDGTYFYITLTYMDSSSRQIMFDGGISGGRCFDLDNNQKQYALDASEYLRFLEVVHALKMEQINLKGLTFEPSLWAQSDIAKAIINDLVPKWNQINYTENISRLEVCQLVENLLRIKGHTDEPSGQKSFLDINDTSVDALSKLNIIDGKSEKEFYPYDYIKREEFAKILLETYRVVSDNNIPKSSEQVYKDYEQISDWASDSVQQITALGLMIGDDNGKFNPQNNITKEQVIITLLRLYELPMTRSAD